MTDDEAVEAAQGVLDVSTRVALVSVMDHSAHRTRFASLEEHRHFYAADWGVPLEEVDAFLALHEGGIADRDDRRREVAALASKAGVVLASHDDRDPSDVDAALELGATVAEFPLTVDAARHAQRNSMVTVLGAPNAVRGRSTSPGNLLVADAVRAGVCDVLCSDYLPSSLQAAAIVLAETGVCDLAAASALVSAAPACAIGIAAPETRLGEPLTATLRTRLAGTDVGITTWRDGRRVHARVG